MTGDPYRAPDAAPRDDAPVVRPASPWVLAIVLLPAVLTALMVSRVVPSFAAVFADFGSALPVPTDLLVRGHLAVWLWPVLVAVAFAAFRRRRRGGVVAAAISLAGSALLVGLTMWALYLPMMKLAA